MSSKITDTKFLRGHHFHKCEPTATKFLTDNCVTEDASSWKQVQLTGGAPSSISYPKKCSCFFYLLCIFV